MMQTVYDVGGVKLECSFVIWKTWILHIFAIRNKDFLDAPCRSPLFFCPQTCMGSFVQCLESPETRRTASLLN